MDPSKLIAKTLDELLIFQIELGERQSLTAAAINALLMLEAELTDNDDAELTE